MGMHVICILALSSILFIGTFIVAFSILRSVYTARFFIIYTTTICLRYHYFFKKLLQKKKNGNFSCIYK